MSWPPHKYISSWKCNYGRTKPKLNAFLLFLVPFIRGLSLILMTFRRWFITKLFCLPLTSFLKYHLLSLYSIYFLNQLKHTYQLLPKFYLFHLPCFFVWTKYPSVLSWGLWWDCIIMVYVNSFSPCPLSQFQANRKFAFWFHRDVW